MKKSLVIIFIGLLWSTNIYSNDWYTRINEKIYDEFKVNKKMKLPLDGGEWTLIANDTEMITHGIGVSTLTFVQLENNIPNYRVNEQSSNSKQPVSKGWFLNAHKAVGVVFEIGDTTPRDRIRLIGKEAAISMMSFMINL